MAGRSLRIGLIPGDGIGREVIPAGRRLLESLPSRFNLKFQFQDFEAGWGTFEKNGEAISNHTLNELGKCEGALFGAVSSPTHSVPGYSSPIVRLRKHLSLYANVRPVKTVASPLLQAPHPHSVDMVIVRENTEDLYVKKETTKPDPEHQGETIAEAIKQISSFASKRIGTVAAELALRRQRVREQGIQSIHSEPKVTVTHKSNVLPGTDGLFRRTCLDLLSNTSKFASIKRDEQIIDSLFYKLFLAPSQYDVIVAPNLYGDLLSDAAAALVGSLGVVPSANVSEGIIIGEPCHGSAPDIAGQNIANPIATLRSVGLMLEFLNEEEAAGAVYKAVDANLTEGKIGTPDLGGKSKTDEVVEDVIKRLE